MAVRELLRKKVTEVWGEDQFQYLDYVIDHESDYVLSAQNPHSSACGLGQFIPCHRYGSDQSDLHKHRSAERQVEDLIRYVRERPNYGNPYQAYLFKLAKGWY